MGGRPGGGGRGQGHMARAPREAYGTARIAVSLAAGSAALRAPCPLVPGQEKSRQGHGNKSSVIIQRERGGG